MASIKPLGKLTDFETGLIKAAVPELLKNIEKACVADLTVLETFEDCRSVRHPYASSVMLDKVGLQVAPRFSDTHEPDADMGCVSCGTSPPHRIISPVLTQIF